MYLPSQKELLTTLEERLDLYTQQVIHYAKNDLWTEESLKQLKEAILLSLKALQLITLSLITVCIGAVYFPLLLSNIATHFVENKVNPEIVEESKLNKEFIQLELDFGSLESTTMVTNAKSNVKALRSADVEEQSSKAVVIPPAPLTIIEILQTPINVLWQNISETVVSKVKTLKKIQLDTPRSKDTGILHSQEAMLTEVDTSLVQLPSLPD
jgi:hypothetical protein